MNKRVQKAAKKHVPDQADKALLEWEKMLKRNAPKSDADADTLCTQFISTLQNAAADGKKKKKKKGPRRADGSSEDEGGQAKGPATSHLHVEIKRCKNLKKVQFFGKQDPYAQVSVGGETHMTAPKADGDTFPRWDEAGGSHMCFEQPAQAKSMELVVEIWNANKFIKDELVATAELTMQGEDHQDEWLDLNSGGQVLMNAWMGGPPDRKMEEMVRDKNDKACTIM